VQLILDHDDAWLPVLGVDDVPTHGHRLPPDEVLDAWWQVFAEQEATAGFLLAPQGVVLGAASLHVQPGTGAETVVELFREHDLVVSDTDCTSHPTPLGIARRLEHLRLLELVDPAPDEPRVVLWRHLLWIWQLDDHDGPVTVTVTSESPSPQPAADLTSHVDDLARGLRRAPIPHTAVHRQDEDRP